MGNKQSPDTVDVVSRSKDEEEADFSKYSLTKLPESINIKITKLNLSKNLLTNDNFLNLKLETLEWLNLNENNLTSTKNISFNSFPKLQKLILSNNQIEFLGENEVASFPELLSLDLSNNKIKTLPNDFPMLKELKNLSISQNFITSDLLISQLPNLYSIDITKNTKLHQLSKELKSKVTYLDSDHPDEIIHGLYLGNVDSALNIDLLKELGVTHVLSICKELTKDMVSQIKENFDQLWIQADDADNEDLLYDECYNYIHKARENNGKVLVHCWMGISRSSSITIMYIMKLNKMTFQDAYQFVRGKRPQVSPNYGFIVSLKQFEKTLDIQ